MEIVDPADGKRLDKSVLVEEGDAQLLCTAGFAASLGP